MVAINFIELAKKCRGPTRSSVHVCKRIWTVRDLRGYHNYLAQQLSTQCALPCTHGTCDNNGALSIEVWQKVSPEFIDSKLQITVQLAYRILLVPRWLGLSIEVWQKVFPEFLDSKLQITVQPAYRILLVPRWLGTKEPTIIVLWWSYC